MMPFVYRGLWSKIQTHDQNRITLGFINGVSPRGMFGWFSLREAIGMQSRGFQPKGDRADYHDRAPIRGLITLGYKHHLGKHLTLQAWNFHLDRLTNMTWLQADAQYKHFFGGLQYVQERASSYQKRLPYDQRYYQPGEVGQVLSLTFD